MRVKSIAVLAVSGLCTILIFQNCAKAPNTSAPAPFVPNVPSSESVLTGSGAAPEDVEGTPNTSLIANRLDGLQIKIEDSNKVSKGRIGTRLTLNTTVEYDVLLTLDTADDTAKEREEFKPPAARVTIPAGETSAQVSVDLIGETALRSTKFKLKITSASLGKIARGTATMTIPAWTPYAAMTTRGDGLKVSPPSDYSGWARVKDLQCVKNATTKKTKCTDTTKNVKFFDLVVHKHLLCQSITTAGIANCIPFNGNDHVYQPEGGYCVDYSNASAKRDYCYIEKAGAADFIKRRNCTAVTTASTQLMRRYVCVK